MGGSLNMASIGKEGILYECTRGFNVVMRRFAGKEIDDSMDTFQWFACFSSELDAECYIEDIPNYKGMNFEIIKKNRRKSTR